MPRVSQKQKTLNLSASPYAVTTPMETLFPGAMRRATLDQLLQLSRNSRDIIAVVGPTGSGKTLIGDFFVRQASKDQIVARARASLLTSPSQLLEEMFKSFVLDFPPRASIADLKSALQRYFAAVRSQGRTVVLVVDDAHELGDDALAMLTRLALVDDAEGIFHLILLGEPQLFDMLDYTCPLRNGAHQFRSLQLPEFSLEETREYLRFRLNSVGYNRADQGRALPFSNRQIEKIHRQSGGQPGAINHVAEEWLNAPRGGAAILHLLDNIPKPYALAMAALLTVLLFAFFSGGGDEEVEVVQGGQRVISVPVSVSSSASGLSDTLPATDELLQELVPLVPPSSAADATPTVTDAQAMVSTPVTDPQANLQSLSPEIQQPAPAAELTSVQTPPAPAANDLEGQRAWILALPSTQFTLQVLGSSSRNNVETFVGRNTTSALMWFETRNNDKPWFVVVQGSYASRDAAQSAIAALPSELRNLQPFVRSLADVQSAVRAQN